MHTTFLSFFLGASIFSNHAMNLPPLNSPGLPTWPVLAIPDFEDVGRASSLGALRTWSLSHPEELRIIYSALEDQNSDARIAAIAALVKAKENSEETRSRLGRLINDRDPRVVSYTLLSMTKLWGKNQKLANQILADTTKLFYHQNADVQSNAVEVAVAIGEAALPMLNLIINTTRDVHTRTLALEAVGKIGFNLETKESSLKRAFEVFHLSAATIEHIRVLWEVCFAMVGMWSFRFFWRFFRKSKVSFRENKSIHLRWILR